MKSVLFFYTVFSWCSAFSQEKIPALSNGRDLSDLKIDTAIKELAKQNKATIIFEIYSEWTGNRIYAYKIIAYSKKREWASYRFTTTGSRTYYPDSGLTVYPLAADTIKAIWKTCVSNGLFSLSEKKDDYKSCDLGLVDAASYVFIIIKGMKYKEYIYYSPADFLEQCPESPQTGTGKKSLPAQNVSGIILDIDINMPLIHFTDKGLFCPQGGFYIDPWKPVDKAVISHGHSDHARPGNKYYLCHHFTKPILQLRLGENHYESIGWDEPVFMNGVSVSFFPAGHIIGSAQVRVEYKGEVWVFTGDFKTEDDGISTPYVPVRCNYFITECTFGLPIYKWRPQEEIFTGMKEWIGKNHAADKSSVFIAYSLGKAQRILKPLAETGLPMFAHGAVYNVHKTLQNAGWKLPDLKRVTPETTKEELKGCIVIAPSGAEGSPWIKRFSPYATGICSGWMQVRGNMRRKNADAGFALSDHADWEGLIASIKATGAEKVFATHGFQSAFSRYLNSIGIEAGEVKTAYGNDEEEAGKEEEMIDARP